ncbi:hypothetical protein GCM10007276_27300 [Agaricicola taiwanensis]|uniref:DUF2218 domain-containing protein n=1 Tax=Agaricicola taiwanensis TaxID=591372 RepID=A0A8J3DW24_9RHOB|nr:DUF2218 domain-containing protein [Agaricicola taiwanensis]GGE48691.1 hypothetical protein GCM10007276_27300 [Agaricicola taiwanensis]
MSSTTAAVPTEHAERYLQQLCKHWAHKLQVEVNDNRARIVMPSGAITSLDAGTDALDVRIDAADAEMLAITKDVVVRHLDRFAFREAPLAFHWTDDTLA